MRSLSLLAVSLPLLLCSCSTIGRWFKGEPSAAPAEATQETRDDGAVGTSNRELELKFAKLWARVDELDDTVSKQKQRISVLEKGLMLGILPEELKSDAERASGAEKKVKHPEPEAPLEIPQAALPHSETTPPAAVAAAATSPDHAPAKANRPEVIAQAQQFFEQGQYGRALALYSSLDGEADQSHRYWVGLCWMKLKEYETAHKEFSEFVTRQVDSAWVPRAKYHLAQIDYELGYKEKALEQLRKIIQEYPNEDAAQMARSTIQNMEKNL